MFIRDCDRGGIEVVVVATVAEEGMVGSCSAWAGVGETRFGGRDVRDDACGRDDRVTQFARDISLHILQNT